LESTLITVITALFGGAGATLVWELLLKPMRDRRSLAEVLSAEVSINMQLLGAAKVMATPRKVPPDFRLSTHVYNSVLPRLGEPPSALVGEVVFLYRYFEEMNEHPKLYTQLLDTFRATDPRSPHRKVIDREIQATIHVFNSYTVKAINRVNIVQPMLLSAAFPTWSPRKWRRNKPTTLSLDALAAQVADGFRQREEIRRKLEAERPHDDDQTPGIP